MKKTLVFALFFILCLAGAPTVHALTISPARLEITGDPGTVISGEFTLINEQEETKTFYSSAQNFEAKGDSGTPSFTSSSEGLSSWIKLESQVVLSKGEKVVVPFTITIPKNADAGGHFAAIFLSTQPNNPDGGQVSVGAKIGTLILLRVSGDIIEGGGVSNFSTTNGRFWFTSLPISLSYKFKNTGNDRVNPYGDITILDTVPLTVASLPANPGQGNVLPGSARRFDVVWGTIPATPLKTDFFSQAKYELSHFAFGFYTAQLNLKYGNSGTAFASKTFFVFPWQLSLIVLILSLLLLWVATHGIKRYNRWIIAKATQARQG